MTWVKCGWCKRDAYPNELRFSDLHDCLVCRDCDADDPTHGERSNNVNVNGPGRQLGRRERGMFKKFLREKLKNWTDPELPEGFKLKRSTSGRWRWVDRDGFESPLTSYRSREAAIRAAQSWCKRSYQDWVEVDPDERT